jgi:hypothetical protein
MRAWRLLGLCCLGMLGAPTEALMLDPARAWSMVSPQRGAAVPSSRLAVLCMQEGDGNEGGRERKRGRTATVARPKPKPKFDRKEDVDKEKSWRVLVHNDDVSVPFLRLALRHAPGHHMLLTASCGGDHDAGAHI